MNDTELGSSPTASLSNPVNRNWSTYFGYDIFISFALGPPPRGTRSYASDLARKLGDRGVTVYFSEDEAPVGSELDKTIKRGLKRSRALVVVVNRATLAQPRWIRTEVEEFRRFHHGRPVVPINIDGALFDPELRESLSWLGFESKIWADETREAVESGIVSDEVIRRLITAPAAARSLVRLRLTVAAFIAFFALLALVAVVQRNTAIEARHEAETQATFAKQAGERERSARLEEERQRELAEKQTAIARGALESEKLARGEEQRQRQVAERRGQIAMSRQLAAQSVGERSTSQETALLLATAAATMAPTFEARQSLQDAFTQSVRLKKIFHGEVGHVNSIVASDDGRLIASAGDDARITLWDATTGRSIRVLGRHEDTIDAIALDTTARLLASASRDGVVKIWDLQSMQLLNTLRGGGRPVRTVAFAPFGNRLATAGDEGLIVLWDLRTGARVATIGDYTGAISRLAFSPDGSRLAAGGKSRDVPVWDLASGLRVFTLQGHARSATQVVFSPNGTRLASASTDSSVMIWDMETGRSIATLSQEGYQTSIDALAFSPNGERLLSVWVGQINSWDLRTFRKLETIKAPGLEIHALAYLSKTDTLLSAGMNGLAEWNLGMGKHCDSFSDVSSGNAFAFSPDGRLFATGGYSGNVNIWDGKSEAPIATLAGHQGDVRSAVFSPDSSKLATGSYKEIFVWDVKTRRLEAKFEQAGTAWSLAFTPDGTAIVADSENRAVVYSLAGDRRILEGHTDGVLSVAIRADGATLATGGYDKTAILWDIRSGKQLHVLKDHPTAVGEVAFVPGGRSVATLAGSVFLWDVATGNRTRTLRNEGGIAAFAFTPDGNALATSSNYGDVTIINLGSDTALVVLKHERGRLAYSPDGMHLAAIDGGTVNMWDVDVNNWPERACSIANRNLTCKEWKRYVGPEEPYRAVCPALPIPRDWDATTKICK